MIWNLYWISVHTSVPSDSIACFSRHQRNTNVSMTHPVLLYSMVIASFCVSRADLWILLPFSPLFLFLSFFLSPFPIHCVVNGNFWQRLVIMTFIDHARSVVLFARTHSSIYIYTYTNASRSHRLNSSEATSCVNNSILFSSLLCSSLRIDWSMTVTTSRTSSSFVHSADSRVVWSSPLIEIVDLDQAQSG